MNPVRYGQAAQSEVDVDVDVDAVARGEDEPPKHKPRAVRYRGQIGRLKARIAVFEAQIAALQRELGAAQRDLRRPDAGPLISLSALGRGRTSPPINRDLTPDQENRQ
jgi:hypothetical protein